MENKFINRYLTFCKSLKNLDMQLHLLILSWKELF